MEQQLELDVTEQQTKSDIVEIWEWKTIGTQENFTIIGQGDDHKIYYWKDKVWNLL